MKRHTHKANLFERLSSVVTKGVGSSAAFAFALLIIIVWIVTGPLFGYSDTWQLVINTGTTIVTFLIVFLIQRSQNKESMAIQIKLNELIASSNTASNNLIDVQNLSEDELLLLQRYFRELSVMSKKDVNVHESHSIEEARTRHHQKLKKH